MFSHDPLTEETRELLDKMLADDAEAGAEDEKEVEELKKQGINPLPKPPPGKTMAVTRTWKGLRENTCSRIHPWILTLCAKEAPPD
ncbi:zinc finger ccch domain-containing protein 4 [Limosa lapponica baueri]|uniref:Zinc finger ccch domain-containing protein 4 n=1 Tax=Limosa lapponica baueri TaxID=1758121 RepID=A0A2I0T2L9_LIMLA|nr:zinc finger ccch domain-containing protein 4 [Limosa lapponica baueri]